MSRDLYPRPRRLSWAEELDELIAARCPECPPSLLVPAAAPSPVPVAVPAPRPVRMAVRRAEAPVGPVTAPARAPEPAPPPTFAELEAGLAAHGITGLGPKPLVTCPECEALSPNHRVACELIVMPDPDAPKCGSCPYPAGSLGCRMACGGGQ